MIPCRRIHKPEPKQHGHVEDSKTVAPLTRRRMSLQRNDWSEDSQTTRTRRYRADAQS